MNANLVLFESTVQKASRWSQETFFPLNYIGYSFAWYVAIWQKGGGSVMKGAQTKAVLYLDDFGKIKGSRFGW